MLATLHIQNGTTVQWKVVCKMCYGTADLFVAAHSGVMTTRLCPVFGELQGIGRSHKVSNAPEPQSRIETQRKPAALSTVRVTKH